MYWRDIEAAITEALEQAALDYDNPAVPLHKSEARLRLAREAHTWWVTERSHTLTIRALRKFWSI